MPDGETGGVTLRDRLGAYVASRWFPFAAGLVTAFAVAWMWGGLDQPGAFHDERAYVVQARLLAIGSWTAPAPPLPVFWAMPHVFVEPAIFARYPPGFAPLLVPGLWLGLPGLVPVLLAGGAAVLLVLLLRRLAGPWTAAAAWLLWTSSARGIAWHASYFSETATVALYLGALLALHHWVEAPRPRLLLILVVCVGWLGITRPVTGIALALPIAAVLVWQVWRNRRLEGWKSAVVVGLLICSVVPYWGLRTTGSPLRLPYAEYSKEYFPGDMPGFARDTSPPRHRLPPDFLRLGQELDALYADHHPGRIPEYIAQRGAALGEQAVGTRVWAYAWVLAPIGFVLLGTGIAAFAGASIAAMLLAYTLMPHPVHWTLYYLELFPLAAAAAVVALARFPRRLLPLAGVVLVAMVVGNLRGWPREKSTKASMSARQRASQAIVRALPDPHAVIFVRRSEKRTPHFTLVDILGPPNSTPTWIVRDLGATENAQLIQRAGGRRPYMLDEHTMQLSSLQTAAPAP